MSEGGPRARPRVVALIDYENIVKEALVSGQLVDFEKLAELCRSFGEVVASFLFVPRHLSYESWLNGAHEQGFFVVAVPPSASPERLKQHENADTIMIDLGSRMVMLNIDVFVIVTHDADFLTLTNRARDAGRQVVLVAGEKAARILTHAVDLICPLPTKAIP